MKCIYTVNISHKKYPKIKNYLEKEYSKGLIIKMQKKTILKTNADNTIQEYMIFEFDNSPRNIGLF